MTHKDQVDALIKLLDLQVLKKVDAELVVYKLLNLLGIPRTTADLNEEQTN